MCHQLAHTCERLIHPCCFSARGSATPQTWEQRVSTQASHSMQQIRHTSQACINTRRACLILSDPQIRKLRYFFGLYNILARWRRKEAVCLLTISQPENRDLERPHLQSWCLSPLRFHMLSPDLGNHQHHLGAGDKYVIPRLICPSETLLSKSGYQESIVLTSLIHDFEDSALHETTALCFCNFCGLGKKSLYLTSWAKVHIGITLLHGIRFQLKQKTALEMNGFERKWSSQFHGVDKGPAIVWSKEWNVRLSSTKCLFGSQKCPTVFPVTYTLWAMSCEVLKSWGYFNLKGMPNSSHKGDSL